jgi:D-alanyl-D-alanine carboxypeptidase
MKKHSKKLIGIREINLFLALMAVLGVFLFISLAADARKEREASIADISVPHNPFKDVVLNAKAAYVYDIRAREVLYADKEDARLPLASLTKVMSALVATDVLDPDSIVTISMDALMAEGDSGLLVGERWKVKNLIDFSLTTSSNDGIRAVAIAAGSKLTSSRDAATSLDAFVHMMNKRADELGMKNTYYLNETGLDESIDQGGAYGSAEDQAKLIEYVLSKHPELLEATQNGRSTISSLDKVHVAKNTDILTNVIPGLRASKTGFTDIAGGNLIIAFDPELNHPVIVSVLGSTEKGRFADVKKLVNTALAWIATRDLNTVK